MTTPCMIMASPVYPPYTCIRCGLGSGPFRKFFIDIGVSNELSMDLRDHGAIYFCDQCAVNLVNDLMELIRNPPVGIIPDVAGPGPIDETSDTGVSDTADDNSGSEQLAELLQGIGESTEGADSTPVDEPKRDPRDFVDPRQDRREFTDGVGKITF